MLNNKALNRQMPPVHPGEILKEMYMDALELSVQDLADALDVTRKTISLLVNGHSGISVPMALRLSKAFDTSPELWLNMQRDHDLWDAGKKVSLEQVRHLSAAGKRKTRTTVKH